MHRKKPVRAVPSFLHAAEQAQQPGFVFHDLLAREESFREAFLKGMRAPRKSIPCRFLYDARGSALFDEICRLPEYYPTRTETVILRERAKEIADIVGPDAVLIELGSGSSIKTRILLDRMKSLAAYVPIDVSRDHLRAAARAVATDYPSLRVDAVCADYSADFALPLATGGSRVGFFPGSTIGNLDMGGARDLLARWREKLGAGGMMIVGVDLKKDPRLLNAAYDDGAHITEKFIKNILIRANRELGAAFDPASFRYDARYVAPMGRVEMHLVSIGAQTVAAAGETFVFRDAERIHVENSHKYGIEEFSGLARSAGFSSVARFTDANRLFCVHVLAAA